VSVQDANIPYVGKASGVAQLWEKPALSVAEGPHAGTIWGIDHIATTGEEMKKKMTDNYTKAIAEMEQVIEECAQRVAEAFKDMQRERIDIETCPEYSESYHGSAMANVASQRIEEVNAKYRSRIKALDSECWHAIGQIDLKYRIFL